MKLRFGIGQRKTMSGAELAVRVFQITSLLPLAYLLTAPGYPYLFTRSGLLSVLFDLGAAALPRAELWLLSLLYRLSASEVAVHFVILALALGAGLAAHSLSQSSPARRRGCRIVYAGWLALDLLLRLLLRAPSFPLWALIAGFLLRGACLALVLLDLKHAADAASK